MFPKAEKQRIQEISQANRPKTEGQNLPNRDQNTPARPDTPVRRFRPPTADGERTNVPKIPLGKQAHCKGPPYPGRNRCNRSLQIRIRQLDPVLHRPWLPRKVSGTDNPRGRSYKREAQPTCFRDPLAQACPAGTVCYMSQSEGGGCVISGSLMAPSEVIVLESLNSTFPISMSGWSLWHRVGACFGL